ncbi:unnamed protein product [Closterium sp. Naga37s-1]|nr:unnamed protein product [Closterium sp. Naga37s-1]
MYLRCHRPLTSLSSPCFPHYCTPPPLTPPSLLPFPLLQPLRQAPARLALRTPAAFPCCLRFTPAYCSPLCLTSPCCLLLLLAASPSPPPHTLTACQHASLPPLPPLRQPPHLLASPYKPLLPSPAAAAASTLLPLTARQPALHLPAVASAPAPSPPLQWAGEGLQGAEKAEAGKAEAGKAEAGKTEAGKGDGVKAEAGKGEGARAEAGKGDGVSAEEGKGEGVKAEAEKMRRSRRTQVAEKEKQHPRRCRSNPPVVTAVKAVTPVGEAPPTGEVPPDEAPTRYCDGRKRRRLSRRVRRQRGRTKRAKGMRRKNVTSFCRDLPSLPQFLLPRDTSVRGSVLRLFLRSFDSPLIRNVYGIRY